LPANALNRTALARGLLFAMPFGMLNNKTMKFTIEIHIPGQIFLNLQPQAVIGTGYIITNPV
jgi:hypothetical protein